MDPASSGLPVFFESTIQGLGALQCPSIFFRILDYAVLFGGFTGNLLPSISTGVLLFQKGTEANGGVQQTSSCRA